MPFFDEESLLEKLRRIEALHGGATTEGERDAAASAIRRIQERLRSLEKEDPPVEFRFGVSDPWSRRLFLALARRYGLRPYRYPRQRHATVMLRVSRRFLDETFLPEYRELSQALHQALADATERAVSRIHGDREEAEVRAEPAQLSAATDRDAG
jgi:hypothetical protein